MMSFDFKLHYDKLNFFLKTICSEVLVRQGRRHKKKIEFARQTVHLKKVLFMYVLPSDGQTGYFRPLI